MAQWLSFLQSMPWPMASHIALAALLGGIVGLKREWGAHPAGLRTNILVAVGSCLFTVLSIEGFPLRGAAQDSARIAAQIVSGVGFLGAGVLFRGDSQVKGLTTAATIWLVAAIGMAVGAGLYFIAVFTTLLTTAVLVLLKPLSARLPGRARRSRPALGKKPNRPGQRHLGSYHEAPREETAD